MHRVGRLAVVAALVLGAAIALPRATAAHALLQAADPAAGSTLDEAPAAVILTFGEAPDPKLSTIKVLDTAGIDHVAGPVSVVADRADQLTVPVAPIEDGVYTVAWRTVSAVDGHVAAGAYAFGVGVAPEQQPASAAVGMGEGDPWPAAVARWLLYLGLAALLGATFVAYFVTAEPSRDLTRLAVIGWVAAALGTTAVIAVQWVDVGAAISAIVASSIGIGSVARVLIIAVTGLAVAMLARRPAAVREPLAGMVAMLAAATMLVDVLTGHAASGPATPLQVLAQWLHGVGAGLWIGGLAALLLTIRGIPGEAKARAIRRFSTWAAVALVVVAATGLLRAVQEIGSLEALLTTDFGRVVLAKSGIFVCLAALGAVNRFRNVRAAERTLTPVRRVGAVEVALGIAVLLLSAVLVNLAPPSTAASHPTAAPSSVVATAHDFGTTVRMTLTVSPGAAGFDHFEATLVDYDSGLASDASAVSLRFALASQSGVGGSSLDMTPAEPGRFTASGANLSLDGIWRVTATITSPSGSVEVPVVLATKVPSQEVHSVVTAGAPTIDSVHLSGGRSLQAYLDPGAAGANELHLTFFDASGQELPIQSATLVLAPVGEPAEILSPRLLEPGHFVAETSPSTGPLGLDVVAPDPDGGVLHAQFTMQVQP